MQPADFPAVQYSTFAFARWDSSSLRLVITAYPFGNIISCAARQPGHNIDKRSAISATDGRARFRVDNPPLNSV